MIVHCPKCNQKYDIDESHAGQTGTCSVCQNPFTIPHMPQRNENTKQCPACGETILSVAKKCRYCGEIFEAKNIKERELFSYNPHFLYAAPLFVCALIILLLAMLFMLPAILIENADEEGILAMMIISCILLLIAIPSLIISFLQIKKTNYILTTERVLVKYGIITDNTKSIQIKDIRYVDFTQSILQKIFGIATIQLSTAGTNDSKLSLSDIRNYKAIAAKIDSMRKN